MNSIKINTIKSLLIPLIIIIYSAIKIFLIKELLLLKVVPKGQLITLEQIPRKKIKIFF
jgi:hypothetical protein